MGSESDRERMVSIILLLLFLLVAGGTGLFIYRQTHAGDGEVAIAAMPAPAPELAAPALPPPSRAEAGARPLTPPKLRNLPALRENIRKFYPPAQRSAGQEGRVVLALVVEADGSVSRTDVKISGGADFDEAARKVALAMRFSPARKGGEPVPVQIDESVAFTLER